MHRGPRHVHTPHTPCAPLHARELLEVGETVGQHAAEGVGAKVQGLRERKGAGGRRKREGGSVDRWLRATACAGHVRAQVGMPAGRPAHSSSGVAPGSAGPPQTRCHQSQATCRPEVEHKGGQSHARSHTRSHARSHGNAACSCHTPHQHPPSYASCSTVLCAPVWRTDKKGRAQQQHRCDAVTRKQVARDVHKGRQAGHGRGQVAREEAGGQVEDAEGRRGKS